MYLNHKTLWHMAKLRVEEDRRAADYERFIHPYETRLNLMVWQERVMRVLESIDAVGQDLKRKSSTLTDSP